MNDEQERILRMVAEGTISPEEAADLLDALESAATADQSERAPRMPNAPGVHEHPHHGLRRRPRTLVIHIREGGESKVNVRIPLSLTRVAGKFIPRQAQGYLNKFDINLQEFLEEVRDADSGTLLEVKDGENKVLIAVE